LVHRRFWYAWPERCPCLIRWTCLSKKLDCFCLIFS
jgi:hypothetical protein